MTPAEYKRLIDTHGLRGQSVEACRRVLVGGQTAYAVAQDIGIDKSTISRALKRLARPVCQCCGQAIGKD